MNESQHQTAIARRLTLTDLPGILAKRLEVPPGHVGVTVDGEGGIHTLPPGTHTAIGPLRRLFGRVSDWQFAVMPTGPTSLIVPVHHVRCGDGEWVDVTCGVTVRVADPQRFYAQVIQGADGGPPGLTEQLSAGVDGAVRQAIAGWASQDLIKGAVSDRLSAEVRRALSPVADTLGLQLEGVRYVAVRPVEEAVDVARKQAELEAALADVAMERRMSELSTEAEWREFVLQLEADYELPQGALQAELEAPPEEREETREGIDLANLRQAVSRYFESRAAGLTTRVQRLLGARERSEPPPLRWWERVVPWFKAISALLAVVALLVFIFWPEISDVERTLAIIQLVVAIPTAVVLFLSAVWLERKAARERAESYGGPSLLRLGRGDRERIDALVRSQTTTELSDVVHKLRDARDHAYRQGQRDEALAIKRTEERAERLRERVAARRSGTAAYLSQANVSKQALETMLNYDEELLADVSELSDRVQAFRQHVLGEGPADDELREIEGELTELDHQFQARSRFIQAPANATS
jgi:hypothetical protein